MKKKLLVVCVVLLIAMSCFLIYCIYATSRLTGINHWDPPVRIEKQGLDNDTGYLVFEINVVNDKYGDGNVLLSNYNITIGNDTGFCKLINLDDIAFHSATDFPKGNVSYYVSCNSQNSIVL